MCVYIHIFMYTLAIKGKKKIFTIVVYAHKNFGSPLRLFLEIPDLFLINMVVSFFSPKFAGVFWNFEFFDICFHCKCVSFFFCTRQQFFMTKHEFHPLPPSPEYTQKDSSMMGGIIKTCFYFFFNVHSNTGGRTSNGCLKFQISFRRRATDSWALLHIGLFCRKWSVKIRHPMHFCHPIVLHSFFRTNSPPSLQYAYMQDNEKCYSFFSLPQHAQQCSALPHEFPTLVGIYSTRWP